MTIIELENLLVYTKILGLENLSAIVEKYKNGCRINENIIDFYRRITLEFMEQ